MTSIVDVQIDAHTGLFSYLETTTMTFPAIHLSMSYRLIALGALLLSTTAQAQPALLEGRALTDALIKGGYTLFFRHTATDQSIGDQDKPVVTDCTTQRNLSREGRIEARAIGQTIDSLQIPIGRVFASPYCRAMETARLGFARAEANEALVEQKPQNDVTAKIAEAGLRPLLAAVPSPGTNTVLVSHGFNLRSIAGFSLAEGESAIYLPDGKGNFNLVARILPAKWSGLTP